MDRAAFAAGHGWPVGQTPAARSAPSRSEGAAPRVCSLWLLSLAQARESDSAARRADEKTQGRESVFARTPKKERWAKAHPIRSKARRESHTTRKKSRAKANVKSRQRRAPEGLRPR